MITLPAILGAVPKAFVPASVVALNHLVGAALQVPIENLKAKASRISSEAEAKRIVDLALANAVAGEISGDRELIKRAATHLLRKEYQKQDNRETVAKAAFGILSSCSDQVRTSEPPEEDWLNIFSKFAEEASSDRTRALWAKVLAGEIRRPGQFSLRALRFLSELSRQEAALFEEFCQSSFGNTAPPSLFASDGTSANKLMRLQELGLIIGGIGPPVTTYLEFGHLGHCVIEDGGLAIMLKAEKNTRVHHQVFNITSLGEEIRTLVTIKSPEDTLRRVAMTYQTIGQLEAGWIGRRKGDQIQAFETLWGAEPTILTD